MIGDAPPLACAAAAAAGIPSVVISNFTWDWIYEGYAERFDTDAPEVLPIIRDAYAQANEGWRLPMGGGFATFQSVVDFPFVERQGRRDLQHAWRQCTNSSRRTNCSRRRAQLR